MADQQDLDDAMALLTDQERAALEDGEDDEGGVTAAEETPAETAIDEPVVEDAASTEDPPAVEAKASEAPAIEGDAPQDDAPSLSMRYKADLPEDFETRTNAIREANDALVEKFRNGEIEADEFQAEMSKIVEQREGLVALRVKAEIAQEMNAQSAEQEWGRTLDKFMVRVAKDEAIDYRNDEAKSRDLDSFVRALANDPANADKTMNWFVTEAHRRVRALHGIVDAAAAPPAAADKPVVSRKPPIAAVPKTLAQVPGGPGPGDVSGEFVSLDSLDGLELEDAVARLSPAQRERWMKAA